MDKSRNGIFTSSQIYRLMKTGKDKKSFGAPALSYIKEKQREIKLMAPINLETTSHSLSWGKAIEGYAYDAHLELSYSYESQNTIVHESKMFGGTPDFVGDDCIADVKCPLTRTSFCDLVEIVESQDTEFFKEQHDEYYYQLVSNALLAKKAYAELIVFMPYESEMPYIMEYLDLIDDYEIQRDIQWAVHSDISRLPHIPDNSDYKNLYRFKFLVPESDKAELLEKITVAHQHKINI